MQIQPEMLAPSEQSKQKRLGESGQHTPTWSSKRHCDMELSRDQMLTFSDGLGAWDNDRFSALEPSACPSLSTSIPSSLVVTLELA